MKLPAASEYVAVVQNPQIAFRDDPELARATIESRMGLPKAYSGGFTVTFHAVGPDGEWAIRCFTRNVSDVRERYAAITRFSLTSRDPMFARAELVREGILVAGRRHDLIKMEWLKGATLDAYVRDRVRDGAALRGLADRMVELGKTLDLLGMAHGDLQHGNVLVTDAGELRLVDYDDMYLPELSRLAISSGVGHENYQHPGRTGADFDARMDRFSLIVLYVSLHALALDPSLFASFDGGDECLLFRRQDYVEPTASDAFATVAKLPAMTAWIVRLAAICAAPYAGVPTLDDFLAGADATAVPAFRPKSNRTKRPSASANAAPMPLVPRGFKPSATPRPSFGGTSPRAAPAYLPSRSSRPGSGSSRSLALTAGGAIAFGIAGAFGLAQFHVFPGLSPAPAAHASAAGHHSGSGHSKPPQSAARKRVRERERAEAENAAATVAPAPLHPVRPAFAAAPAKKKIVAAHPAATPKRIARVCAPDAAARLISRAAAAHVDGAGGHSVVLEVAVTATGGVASAGVVDSSGDPGADGAARDAAYASSFAPAVDSCQRIPGTVRMTVSF